MKYLCQWSIDVDAETPEQAALIAEDLMALRIESAWNVIKHGLRDGVTTIDTTIWLRALCEAVVHDVVTAVGWMYDDHADDGQSIGYCPLSHVGPALVHTILATIDPATLNATRGAH